MNWYIQRELEKLEHNLRIKNLQLALQLLNVIVLVYYVKNIKGGLGGGGCNIDFKMKGCCVF